MQMKNSTISLLILIGWMSADAQRAPQSTKHSPAGQQQHVRREKPNIIFFLVDDMGWSDLGCYGSTFYETPNIDAFAKENIRFTQAYAASHVCSPSRASIISGKYPARLHLTDWLPGRREFPFQKLKNAEVVQHLPYNQPTLPGILKENGYHTAIIGKWHLGEDSASTSRQGFEMHLPAYNLGWPNGTYFSPFGMEGLDDGRKGEYLTDRLTDEALKYIEENREHPFFLLLSHYAVHDPVEGRGDLVHKYEKKLQQMGKTKKNAYILEGNPDDHAFSREELDELLKDERYAGYRNLPNRIVKIKQLQDNPEFAAMVESVDESFGRVLQQLKTLKLDDNTIIVFFSDNGGMSAANFHNPARKISECDLDKAFSTSNLPLRGGKGWLYEGGIREPLMIRWPGKQVKSGVCETPVVSTDFLPTLLDMAGISVPARYEGDGMSITPLLLGNRDQINRLENRAIYWHFPQYSNHGAQSPGGAIRYGKYKLIEYFENFRVELFDLQADPGEQHDLSATAPAIVKDLTRRLHNWRKSVNANMPVPNKDYDPSLNGQWQDWRPGKQLTGKK